MSRTLVLTTAVVLAAVITPATAADPKTKCQKSSEPHQHHNEGRGSTNRNRRTSHRCTSRRTSHRCTRDSRSCRGTCTSGSR